MSSPVGPVKVALLYEDGTLVFLEGVVVHWSRSEPTLRRSPWDAPAAFADPMAANFEFEGRLAEVRDPRARRRVKAEIVEVTGE